MNIGSIDTNTSSSNTTKNLPSWTSDSHCSQHGKSLSFRLGLTHENCLLFHSADFTLQGTTCLVGTNGSGKSTLAKTLSHLPGFPTDFAVEYVSTEEGFLNESSDTPIRYLHNAVQDTLQGLRNQIEELENDNEDVEAAAVKLSELYEVLEELEESSEKELRHSLDALAFTPTMVNKSLSALSSGWRYKCRLVAAFLIHSNLLIIDEPSFLDDASMSWLIQKIKSVSEETLVLLISHKEALLDRVADRILYINSENKTLTSYNCGYLDFRNILETQRSHAERTVTHAAKAQEQAVKSLKNVQTQLRRREASLKSKTSENADQRFVKGKNKEAKQKADKSAASKVKQLQRQSAEMEELRGKAKRERVTPLHIDGSVSAGTLATLEQVSFSYDETILFENVDVKLGPTDKVLLCGPNGVGKTTLIQLLLGELEPTKGRLVRQGKFLYFPQTAMSDMMHQVGHKTPLNYLGGNLTETQTRHHLGQFGLMGDVAHRSIASLSAGQRVRLWLAWQVLHSPKPSLLVLDEISENVDVDTRDSLIELLHSFVGAVVVISHDLDFCSLFNPNQTWTLHRYGLAIEYCDTD